MIASIPQATLQPRFDSLVKEWKAQRNGLSSDNAQLAMCLPYQKIIAMGPEVIPLSFSELERDPDHWFWALHALTDANPVQEKNRGEFDLMVHDWLSWGARKWIPFTQNIGELTRFQTGPLRTPEKRARKTKSTIALVGQWRRMILMGPHRASGWLWPAGVPETSEIENFIKAYETFGFVQCDDFSLESGYEKLVIYSIAGFAVHAARQLPTGLWTSKLGVDWEDIEHDSLEVLADGEYGRPAIIMRKAIIVLP